MLSRIVKKPSLSCCNCLSPSPTQVAAGVRVPLAAVLEGGDITITTRHALAMCAEADELLLVCGSFYILADVRRALGLHDVVDTFDLHERTAPAAALRPT